MKTIVLTGGGTAGHCIPHFAILSELNSHFDKIYYIGSYDGIEKELVSKKGLPYFCIPTVKLKRSLSISNLLIPFKLLNSVKEAEKILQKLKPTVVFSKGGFVGLPVTIASKNLSIPVVIHESDMTLGLSNKLASKYADYTLTSFEETASSVKNGVYVGSPIREELFTTNRLEAIKKYGFSGKKPVLLVTGGSLGARAINQAIINSIKTLTKTFSVIHVVGKGNLTNHFEKDYFQTEFTDMKYALNASDVILSRAGSNTVFEILALKKPAVLVPLPKAQSRGDQIQNANYFYDKGLIKLLEQKNLTPETLIDAINKAYSEKERLISNIKNANLPIANAKITKILTQY